MARLVLLGLLPLALACRAPRITAVPLSAWNSNEKHGIPFYLPKPLLIVAKNFRNIEEAKVGLTDTAPIPTSFDDQAKYADLNARTSFVEGPPVAGYAPSGLDGAAGESTAEKSAPRIHSDKGAPLTPGDAPSDGLAPDTFYTYQIVFVPDMSQKYGLRIRGGPGEIRAAMNLVNGWQFTGLGPYYMKNSSTAQNVLAGGIAANLAGRGVADVVSSIADLSAAGTRQAAEFDADDRRVQEVVRSIGRLDLTYEPFVLPNFAEIHVYEPHLTPDGRMEWTDIVCLNFDRQALGTQNIHTKSTPIVPPLPGPALGALQSGQLDPLIGRAAVAQALGIPLDSPALIDRRGVLPAGDALGGVNQVNVDCEGGCAKPKREFNFLKLGPFGRRHHERPRIEQRAAIGFGNLASTPSGLLNPSATPQEAAPPLQSGDAQSSATSILNHAYLNQPVLNQPTVRDGILPPPTELLPETIESPPREEE